MRKNTARHWLHATLDLLPVILIPVFMIYSHRHDLSTDITIQQDVYKDFYQGVKNGKPTSDLDFIDYEYNSDVAVFYRNEYLCVSYNDTFDYEINFIGNMPVSPYAKLYFSFDYISFSANIEFLYESVEGMEYGLYYGNFGDSEGHFSIISETYYENYDTLDYIYFALDNDFYVKNIQIFDLTSIFGSGNEPSKEVFESYLTQDYYEFGSNEVKVGTIDVQAKNNDIMSVFMDSFNNSVNKYFNMGNVFNLNNVYEWFNANLFGGNAPVVIYSVYNIVVYELVMDLLFLLYALFMWFLDMLKRLMEKPLDSIK